MQPIADVKLDLNTQAWDILQLLAKESVDENREDVEMQTSVWYNCRERGVCLQRINWKKPSETLHIAFAEDRNSDDIVVYYWFAKTSINPPTPANMSDSTWDSRKFFPYGEYQQVIDYIKSLLETKQVVEGV